MSPDGKTHSPTFSGGYFDESGDGSGTPDYDSDIGDYFTYDIAYYGTYLYPSVYRAWGTFTVTFTWQPDKGKDMSSDPPPKSVVLYEWAEADCDELLGTCDDGLGDPPVFISEYGGYWASYSPQGHYRALPGGPTVTYTRTASADPDDYGGDYMFYSASAHPVTIDLTGQPTDTDGSFQALTGQQITAKFNTNCGGGTVSNYQWSTQGGHPFFTWDYIWPNPNYGTQYVPLTFDNYLNNSHGDISYYDAQDRDEVTASCTATITFPNGTST